MIKGLPSCRQGLSVFFCFTFLTVCSRIVLARHSGNYNGDTSYWQQRTDYTIEVILDDSLHELRGHISVAYHNHSPDTLSFIWFHLYPNAYKDHSTAFARQQLENGNTAFYFSKPAQRGFIDSLHFQTYSQTLAWDYHPEHADICKVYLPKPLAPGQSIVISTPFRVKIPESFSRLGHVGQSYQITQWYPKPAVYDQSGWHPMPYLDQGEFYSEYGSFDVKITLPKNYVVGASGSLQNPEEQHWLDSLAQATAQLKQFKNEKGFPPSDTVRKTLHYKLDYAHDFAWFADKRFYVLKGSVMLPDSSREVTSWALFTARQAHLWEKSIEYLNDAIKHYSAWIGNYPYDQVTAVEGALSAGGGMEYPAITIIGSAGNDLSLETVIVHEVGHNWFYGALGSNERDHPWMDEGINSFYETRYLLTKYPKMKWPNTRLKGIHSFFDLHYNLKITNELLYLYNALREQDQSANLPSEAYTDINYGAIVYAKTAICFDHLMAYLGDSLFDSIMQDYYNKWKFKHPQPDDLRRIFEAGSGKDLSWFFDDLLGTNKKVDYAITRVKKDKINDIHTLRIKNRSGMAPPVPVSAIRKDEVVKTFWVEGFSGTKEIEIKNDGYTDYRIDALRNTTEINRKNNNYRLQGLLHRSEKLRFQLLGSLHNPERTQLFFVPAVWWNNYDKTVVGIALYNHVFPFKKFEFELVPMFGTASLSFVGAGRIGYTFYPQKSKLHNINLSLHGKRFGYDLIPAVKTFSKLQPVLTLAFKKKNPRSLIDKKLTLRHIYVWLDKDYKNHTRYYVNEASFHFDNARVINPFHFSATLQQGSEYLKLSGEFRYQLTYNKPSKGLHIRLFAGGFLWQNVDRTRAPIPFLRMNSGTGYYLVNDQQNDYTFDEFYFGRTESTGFFSQQIVVKEGGFRSIIPTEVQKNGISKSWLTAININSTIPGKIPIRPFVSFGMFGQDLSKFNIAFELGLAIIVLPDIFEINFPLVTLIDDPIGDLKKWFIGQNTKEIRTENLYQNTRYWSLITFTFNLKKMNPFELIRTMKL
ncbi:MAG: hypothetical protein KatS3mg031_1531 [Chitinophagales bacterium]|nr:MAG: hypothetical protein KatS3mg031_1531 [Chitinophagales bacterium]